jgi:hypothetical protein
MQAVQEVLPAVLLKPLAQAVQVVLEDWKVPAAQTVHPLRPVLTTWPAGQNVQMPLVVVFEYCSVGQAEQVVEPMLEVEPSGQIKHTEPDW